MSDSEFDWQASLIGAELLGESRAVQIAAACRGSGNPGALAWVAEGLGIVATSTVIDLGAGLGGPAAWLADRYRCRPVALEPAAGASDAARNLFGGDIDIVLGSAHTVPFCNDSFEVALLLGVVSVVDDVNAVLVEARRIGTSLGVMDYCATASGSVKAGGSVFLPVDALQEALECAGWSVDQSTNFPTQAPNPWREAAKEATKRAAAAADEDADDAAGSQAEVVAAIEEGEIALHLICASRR